MALVNVFDNKNVKSSYELNNNNKKTHRNMIRTILQQGAVSLLPS